MSAGYRQFLPSSFKKFIILQYLQWLYLPKIESQKIQNSQKLSPEGKSASEEGQGNTQQENKFLENVNIYKNIIMQVLQMSEDGQSSDSECWHHLQVALEAHGFRRVRTDPVANTHRDTYHGTLFLPRAQASVQVVWRVRAGTAGSAGIQIGLASGGVGAGLCGFLVQVGAQVQQFTYLLNNLALGDRQGYFVFKQLTGQLFFRYKITKTRYLPANSRPRYLRRSLATVTSRFVEHLESIIFYYRLPGFSLSELQEHLQPQNHVALKKQRENIIYLQHYFEAQRWQRKGTSTEHYQAPIRPFQAYTSLLLTAAPQMRAQVGQLEQKVQAAQAMFKFQAETLVQDLSHRKKKNSELILTSIKIKERAKEAVIGSGGYAEIIFGIYSYVPQLSIYSHPSLSVSDDVLMKNCSLVKKKGIQTKQGDINISLQNQFNFLKYIRNKVCPYIAKYYCNGDIEPFADGQIFLEYYPNNLSECRLTEHRKMKVMEDVCMALLFLAEEHLIHRDLKELNIMVDRYHRGRLIDFGSVSNINGSNKFKTSDEKVRSTIGYYIPYRQAVTICPSLEHQLSRQEYYSHEAFDLYGLGQVMENEFYLGQVAGSNHFLRHSLLLLSRKCREINPEDRWTIHQVMVFLRHLLLFYDLQKEFWRCGFDMRLGAHELGSSYNGTGGYDARCEGKLFRPQLGSD